MKPIEHKLLIGNIALAGVVVMCLLMIAKEPIDGATNEQIADLQRQLRARDQRITQLESALRDGAAFSPGLGAGTTSRIEPDPPLSVSPQAPLKSLPARTGTLAQLGQYQLEQQGSRVLFTDNKGDPAFVFDSETRSIVALNGLFIPEKNRLV